MKTKHSVSITKSPLYCDDSNAPKGFQYVVALEHNDFYKHCSFFVDVEDEKTLDKYAHVIVDRMDWMIGKLFKSI
jgi:hypothetical protein